MRIKRASADCCFAGHLTPRFGDLRRVRSDHGTAARSQSVTEHPPTVAAPRRRAAAAAHAEPAAIRDRCPHATESRIRRSSASTRRTACNPQSPDPPQRLTFTPAGHLPQPARAPRTQAPLIFQRRGATASTVGASRVHGQSPSAARSCPACRRKTRPIQRNDHLRAGCRRCPASSMRKRSRRRRLDCLEPIHLLHTMLGTTYPWPGPSRAPLMDCQRSARQHAKGGLANDSTSLACRSPSTRR